ncbi:predicted protein [Naegleria gruberi]|uniref:Predicted protein n=1 Tax=Naegleria gruberi TaxID=5762 RepID=D2W2M8_NAEGR|nr:uncharacterized protein NAEGRDRAFT_75645 [Naegleria gruberi]EFC36676.1 predicted protein [Naegleria gruberi]|eukprot:XP_002669420.1 predicted protein [Naegleria gruberi strain NEG-M]
MAVAAQSSCFLPTPPTSPTTTPLTLPIAASAGTFNYLHHGLTTTCTSSSAVSPQSPTAYSTTLMNSLNHVNSLSDMNVHAMMNVTSPSVIPVDASIDYSSIQQQFLNSYYPFQSVILPEEKEHDDSMLNIEPSVDIESQQQPMLRLDVNDMLTSWTDLFNECNIKGSCSPTSTSSSVTSTLSTRSTTSPFNTDASYESASNQSGEELSSPKSVDAASNIRIQLKTQSTNVYNINKIVKPEHVFKQRKSVLVTSEDSKKIELINKSRFKEKKSRKRMKYPGESSLHIWKWME